MSGRKDGTLRRCHEVFYPGDFHQVFTSI